MLSEREPVRLGGWASVLVGLALNAIIQWAMGVEPMAILGGSASMALSVIGGLEWARGRAYAPTTVRSQPQ